MTLNDETEDCPPPGAGVTTAIWMVPLDVTSEEGTDAVISLALNRIDFNVVVPHCTDESDTNPEPFTSSLNAPLPSITSEGENEEIVGTGLFTVNVAAADVPPPGDGVSTEICAVPAVTMSEAGTTAVISVALTKVDANDVPPHCTIDPATNPEPLTCSVSAEPPVIALAGVIEVIEGAGLSTINVEPADVPPPGAAFTAVNTRVPGIATSAAFRVTVTCVALPNDVGRAFPFTFTTVPVTNPVPVTPIEGEAAPSGTVDGLTDEMTGAGFITCRFTIEPDPLLTEPFITVTVSCSPVVSWLPGMIVVSSVPFT
jgi:hypothetical protein